MNPLLDTALDRAIVLGYSRIGYLLRARGWEADDPGPRSMSGRRVLVTGANSGLGKATALARRSPRSVPRSPVPTCGWSSATCPTRPTYAGAPPS